MPQRLRIFVSSPTDVPDERLRADLIVDKLSQDYAARNKGAPGLLTFHNISAARVETVGLYRASPAESIGRLTAVPERLN